MPLNKYPLVFALLLSTSVSSSYAWEFSGNAKYTHTTTTLDTDSLTALSGNNVYALNSINLRMIAEQQSDHLHFNLHYTLTDLHSNHALSTPLNIDDDTSLFDLSHVISDDADHLSWHRIDRLSVDYTTENFVARFGRQALTWGNGFVFNTMDIFNPFNPTAIDREYKPGDDMLYLQWLLNSGSDIQFILLPRRNTTSGDIESDQSSLAIKSKTITTFADIDLLLARHYADNVVVIGFTRTVGESLWRTDISTTFLEDGSEVSALVTNMDYSWVWLKHNVYGFIEYYYNGFGDTDFNAAPSPELSNRLSRGELFTAYRNHLSGGLQIELHPLLQFSPTLILNTDDNSTLLSLAVNYSWKQNLTLLASIDMSQGNTTSEYGGPASPGDSANLILSYYY